MKGSREGRFGGSVSPLEARQKVRSNQKVCGIVVSLTSGTPVIRLGLPDPGTPCRRTRTGWSDTGVGLSLPPPTSTFPFLVCVLTGPVSSPSGRSVSPSLSHTQSRDWVGLGPDPSRKYPSKTSLFDRVEGLAGIRGDSSVTEVVGGIEVRVGGGKESPSREGEKEGAKP